MTLIVGIRTCDGIVVAADSLGISDPSQEVMNTELDEKISRYGLYALGMAGHRDMRDRLREQFDQLSLGVVRDVRTVAQVIGRTTREVYAEISADPVLQVHMILAGYTSDKVPMLFRIESPHGIDVPIMKQPYEAIGYPFYAKHIFFTYHKDNLSLPEAMAFAVYAITEAYSEDRRIDGPIKLVTVTPGGCDEVSDVVSIVNANTERRHRARDAFWKP